MKRSALLLMLCMPSCSTVHDKTEPVSEASSISVDKNGYQHVHYSSYHVYPPGSDRDGR